MDVTRILWIWILASLELAAGDDALDIIGVESVKTYKKVKKWPKDRRKPHPDKTHDVKTFKLDKYGHKGSDVAGFFKIDVNDFPVDQHDMLGTSHYPSGAQLVFFPDWHPPHPKHPKHPPRKLHRKRMKSLRSKHMYGPPAKPQKSPEKPLNDQPSGQPKTIRKTGYLVMFENMVQDLLNRMNSQQQGPLPMGMGYGSPMSHQQMSYGVQQKQPQQQHAMGYSMQQQPQAGTHQQPANTYTNPPQPMPGYGSQQQQQQHQQPATYNAPQQQQMSGYNQQQPPQQSGYGSQQQHQQQSGYSNQQQQQQNGYGNQQQQQSSGYSEPPIPQQQLTSYASQQQDQQNNQKPPQNMMHYNGPQPVMDPYATPSVLQSLGNLYETTLTESKPQPDTMQSYHPAPSSKPPLTYKEQLTSEAMNAPSPLDLARKMNAFSINTMIHAVSDPEYRKKLMNSLAKSGGGESDDSKDVAGLLVFEQRKQQESGMAGYGQDAKPMETSQSTQGILVLPDLKQQQQQGYGSDPMSGNPGVLIVPETQGQETTYGFLGVSPQDQSPPMMLGSYAPPSSVPYTPPMVAASSYNSVEPPSMVTYNSQSESGSTSHDMMQQSYMMNVAPTPTTYHSIPMPAPAPSYAPAPMPAPAPTYTPTPMPAPTYAPSPVFAPQMPSYAPAPMPTPIPTYSPPVMNSYYPAPSPTKSSPNSDTRPAALIFSNSPSAAPGTSASGYNTGMTKSTGSADPQSGFLLVAPEQQQQQQQQQQQHQGYGTKITMGSQTFDMQLPGVLVIPMDEEEDNQQQEPAQYPQIVDVGSHGKSLNSKTKMRLSTRRSSGNGLFRRLKGSSLHSSNDSEGPNSIARSSRRISKRKMRLRPKKPRKPWRMDIAMKSSSSQKKKQQRKKKSRKSNPYYSKRAMHGPLKGVILPEKFKDAKEKIIMYY